MRTTFALLALCVALAPACSSTTPADTADMAAPAPDLATSPDLAWTVDNALITKRPYQSKAPANYDAAKQYPLVVLLHGLGGDGNNINGYFRLNSLVDSKGFLLAWPDGTSNGIVRFWNATEVCCDALGSGVDDVGYLTAVIGDMSTRYNVDPKRIFVVGHSNGGFMAHRMACDVSLRIAAIVSLAGAQWNDVSKCNPSEPVAVLQVHGTADDTVPYEGGPTLQGRGPAVGSAHETVGKWVTLDKCGATADTSGTPLDLVSALPDAETTIEKWGGCRGVELWTIKGGVHVPSFKQPAWSEAIYDWLMAHPKP